MEINKKTRGLQGKEQMAKKKNRREYWISSLINYLCDEYNYDKKFLLQLYNNASEKIIQEVLKGKIMVFPNLFTLKTVPDRTYGGLKAASKFSQKVKDKWKESKK